MDIYNVRDSRKLLVSVYNAQEAREAIAGGGRIIDSEDPKTALGNISPLNIMAVSDAVLDSKRNLDVQLSTNIGEDQLLFRRTDDGRAIEKSKSEIAGKAAQAAIGVAVAMGRQVHPTTIVKVGLDGMGTDELGAVLSEIVTTLGRTQSLQNTRVMAVLFAQDVATWDERKNQDWVRKGLVASREYVPCAAGTPGAIDLLDFAVNKEDPTARATMQTLARDGYLVGDSTSSTVMLNGLFKQTDFFTGIAQGGKTGRAMIKAMVDAAAKAGAHGLMIDTSILSKCSGICCVDTSGSDEMVDVNALVTFPDGKPLQGILSLDDIRFFVDYCHFKGIVANLAGSISSLQAQQLWLLVPGLNQLSTRGSSSANVSDPSLKEQTSGGGSRATNTIVQALVRGLAPPEQGGVLNVPASLMNNPAARPVLDKLKCRLDELREARALPKLEAFWVDDAGVPRPF
ncbi:(5-formylfuran-3-yl)methyl phosphate synthase [Paucibacter sp. R3-3]|uniref:(5-formylfuran-3-yl)methyl phosphate synthase n=1 Tax=Roseateles agri TaxID=3098619 RepID=A0ABU5DNX8_9BURK|nr:(5-formylfuran-3-yl)methyl phosphate synthase [Paucibacter sp. R3-3]MDY0747988.1 (5-formylfuran-3-yl)methyl phosphate synthase [Paucibacter sp. R3-3]